MRYIYIPLALTALVFFLAALWLPAAALGMWMIDHDFSPIAVFAVTLVGVCVPCGILYAALTQEG
jgi:hypothetical protein